MQGDSNAGRRAKPTAGRPVPKGSRIRIAASVGRGIEPSKLEQLCVERGLKMTGQRRVVARVLSESHDHPDVEQLHRRAVAIDQRISLATVYRTVRLFEQAQILERHEFGDGRARSEQADDEHHDHLIDVETGRVIEFHDEVIERLQREVAQRLGYRLTGHRLELYGRKIDPKAKRDGGA